MDQRRCSRESERAGWPTRFLPLLFLFVSAACSSLAYDLGDVPTLHRKFEARELFGKSLIRVGGDL